MAIKTAIEYCDSTVNPVMGCTGCELYPDHCYAATLCKRYAGEKGWPKDFNSPEYFHGRLEKAIRWPDLTGTERPDKPWLNGRPRIVFVNDLSDGFCPDVDPGGWLWSRLEMMEESPHVWLLLTKWPGRMAKFFASIGGAPDNFWPGTSVLRQSDGWRVTYLLEIKAKVHWLSCEPLLERIKLKAQWLYYNLATPGREDWDGLDFVACGGESGPAARPMHPDWARGIRDQCQAAGVPFHFKQNGVWIDVDEAIEHGFVNTYNDRHKLVHFDGFSKPLVRVGKKKAGRLLDGQEWNEFPA